MDQVVQVYTAQVMRLGYSTIKESIQSCASLCGAAFIASWDSGEDLMRAMDARCYAGKFAVLGENRAIERKPLLALAAFLSLSTAMVILSGTSTII
jgi:cobalt/nickel transport system permease protein